MKIPVHRPSLGEEELQAVRRVFESRGSDAVRLPDRSKARCRRILDVKYVVAVNSGTAALHLALAALDLKPGDKILTPSLTFPSTVQAILAVGAVPEFCEVRSDTLTMDVEDALGRVTRHTTAILPVQLRRKAL